MEWMVFDDLTGMLAIVMLMGLGIGIFVLVVFVYLTLLAIVEGAE
jgi:hypothetical protein